eukprot:357762-Chlamydomonas_euryale.AAC.3
MDLAPDTHPLTQQGCLDPPFSHPHCPTPTLLFLLPCNPLIASSVIPVPPPPSHAHTYLEVCCAGHVDPSSRSRP